MENISTKYLSEINNLELLAKQVVEGFITGLHKSPFHGFSVEFAEHRLYNKGESTKDIDWKLYAKTKKLFVKRYEEETNLRCHIVIDNSASMNFPIVKNPTIENLSKISFSAIASAALMEILKRRFPLGCGWWLAKREAMANPRRSGDRSIRPRCCCPLPNKHLQRSFRVQGIRCRGRIGPRHWLHP